MGNIGVYVQLYVKFYTCSLLLISIVKQQLEDEENIP